MTPQTTQHVTPPYSAPGEPVEFEHTTAGRKPCSSCGEWVYPQRKIGLQSGFAFPPNCQLCGAVLTEETDRVSASGYRRTRNDRTL